MKIRSTVVFAYALLSAFAFPAFGQTTAGSSSTIVVPVIAQTGSFSSEVSVYNPNPATVVITPVFYDAQNTGSPGPKPCTSISVGANVTTAFTLASQCALPAGSNFGLLVMSESTGTNRFYGYTRTQTPQGIGFSTEGFPIENFNDQLQHATALKRVAASGGLPAYQTNCFAATLGDAVDYELRLFDGATNIQLGSTLSGTLAAFQQYRYLDVFGLAGVAAGDRTNVRAQFTNLTGNKKKLIGFCTVQENTNFSADFRIAKSYGGTPQNAFVQGGNAFGTTALIGTTDNQPFEVHVNNLRAMRYEMLGTIPNIVGGSSNNSAASSFYGQTIAGGGADGNDCLDPQTSAHTRSCGNQAGRVFATVSGGVTNQASNDYSTVAGGGTNTASGIYATVSGGYSNLAAGQVSVISGGYGNNAGGGYAVVSAGRSNTADGEAAVVAGGESNAASGQLSSVGGGQSNTASGVQATVPGGTQNTASGTNSLAAGHDALADQSNCVVFGLWSSGNSSCIGTTNVFKVMANNGFSVDYHMPVSGVGPGGDRWLAIGPFAKSGLVPTTIITWNGAYLSDAGVWVNASSSKTRKKDFHKVDVSAVLTALARLPITTWRYREGDGDVVHMGPMAEDFWKAFGIGYGDQTIADLDARGVEFAAIQGLHRLLEERESEIASLRERLSRIETLLMTQAAGPGH